MRTIGLFISDTHGGFKYGLMNPNVKIHDRDQEGNLYAYTPASTKVQQYFWELLLNGCEFVKQYANGDPIVVIHNGDATHGDKYPKLLVSTENADQPVIAISNMEPILSLPNIRSFRLVAGTDAHNFDEADAEKLIIREIKLLYPKINSELVTVGLGDIDGYEIEYSHQGAYPGSKHHLKGNVAHQFLRDRMTGELLAGKTPPGLYLYAHYHEYIFVSETISIGDKDYTSNLITMPSFNFVNLWATAATRAQSRFTHGVVVIEIMDGKLTDVKRLTQTIDRRTKERL